MPSFLYVPHDYILSLLQAIVNEKRGNMVFTFIPALKYEVFSFTFDKQPIAVMIW